MGAASPRFWLAHAPLEAAEEPETERELPRIRAGVSLLGGAFSGGERTHGVVLTLGLSGELGWKFDDRFAVIGRVSAVVNVLDFNLAVSGLAEYAVSERLALAGGASMHYFFGLGVTQSLAATIPVRLLFAPFGRKAHDVARRGILFGLEVAAGAVFFSVPIAGSSPLVSPFWFGSGHFTIGYAWW